MIIMCEYDALPEIGHACGHNLIAECGVATGIAMKKALESDSSLSGKVRDWFLFIPKKLSACVDNEILVANGALQNSDHSFLLQYSYAASIL